ncbi:hypothetical protein [Alistipes senegalensis]|uniref:hypothetical protein n=1 Tax=Alistipes senegalensis TaxID=1288121 RepID=UPI001E5078C2|nr:hypothetical protein [Alistipes senegalensis]
MTIPFGEPCKNGLFRHASVAGRIIFDFFGIFVRIFLFRALVFECFLRAEGSGSGARLRLRGKIEFMNRNNVIKPGWGAVVPLHAVGAPVRTFAGDAGTRVYTDRLVV